MEPPPAREPGDGGVALVAFSTESSHGARADWSLMKQGRALRRRGIPSVVLQVHFHPTDEEENARRADELVRRVVQRGYRTVLCSEMWTAELGKSLIDRGVTVVESRSPSTPGATFAAGGFESVLTTAPGTPLDEYRGLVEIVGGHAEEPVANIDLTVGQACSYQRSISDNPFFAELADDPRFAAHRGCAYCHSATPNPSPPDARDLGERVLDEVRMRRATLPDLRTLWMPFAEVLYDGLTAALDRSRGDPVWRGLVLSMQCRPDVLAERAADIEALAASADDAGTVVKIAVVGFENFSERELLVLNRGVVPDHLRRAAALLERWRLDPPRGLDVREMIPSFILFTPWTRLEDLEQNLAEIEANGLTNAHIERLRLGRATPLYEVARRAGLTSEEPVRLLVHPNGYLAEAAFRFVDPRVAAICAGFDALKPLAYAEQAPLLDAVVDAVRRADEPASIDWPAVAASWVRIRERVEQMPEARPRRVAGAIDEGKLLAVLASNGVEARPVPASAMRPRARPEPAGERGDRVGLGVGRACNNGCQPCVWARRLSFRETVRLPLELGDGATDPRSRSVDVADRIVELAGREPLVRDDLPELIRELRRKGAARVELDTNGRRLVYPSYARALEAAGLDQISVKLFGADARSWDEHTRVPDSFAQTLQGLAVLSKHAPSILLCGMIIPGRSPGTRIGELVDFAASIGLRWLRVVLRLARQDLLALDQVEEQLGRRRDEDDLMVFFSAD